MVIALFFVNYKSGLKSRIGDNILIGLVLIHINIEILNYLIMDAFIDRFENDR